MKCLQSGQRVAGFFEDYLHRYCDIVPEKLIRLLISLFWSCE